MQIKKELLLFSLLLLTSISLLVAPGFSNSPVICEAKNGPARQLCPLQHPSAEQHWDFLTRGILHLSV